MLSFRSCSLSAVLSLALSAPLTAAEFPVTDGVWFLGMQVGADSLSVQADLAGEVGTVTLQRFAGGLSPNPAAFPEVPVGDCTYAIRHQEGVVSAAQLIGGNATCPQSVGMNLRPNDGGLAFDFDGQPVTYPDGTARRQFVLKSNMGPVRGQLAVIPGNLDIFGVRPGMTFAEVNKVLEAAGFRVLGRNESRNAGTEYGTDSWKSVVRAYVRGEQLPSKRFPDKLEVIFSSVAVEEPLNGAVALRIRRLSTLAQPVAPAVMAQALNDKYGLSFQNESDGNGTRVWDRAGQPVTQPTETNNLYLHCGPKGPEEARFPVQLKAPLFSPSAAEGCGSRVDIWSGRDANGLIQSLDITIKSDDLILQDYWFRYAIGIKNRAEPLLSAVEGGGTAAPDL